MSSKQMKHFRIRIEDPLQSARGIMEVSRRGRVVCLRDNQFIIPEPALGLLDELTISYELMGEDDPEETLRKVRDSLATV